MVKESVNEIKIFPYVSGQQEVLQHELFITGRPDVQTYFDYWGNKNGNFNLLSPHNELVIESKLVVRTLPPATLNQNLDAGFDMLEQEVSGNLQMLELADPDVIASQREIETIVAAIYHNGKSVAATVQECSAYIFQHFNYQQGITDVETTVDEILQHHGGVCQDFAHVMLQVLRTLRIPSRYVSGYICPNKNGMRGEGATHAWVEAWLPRYGWAGIDPTNNVWVTNTHVKLAVGRHFNDCSPVKGTFKGPAQQTLSVIVSVGYEDGQSFEGINNVNKQLRDEAAEPVLRYGVHAQQ
jgi:transglutaminase-like putative cysteine protease